jgi:hypothetical protein
MTFQSKRTLLLVSAILALVISILACNLPGRQNQATPESIPVSSQAVEDLATQIAGAAATAVSGGPIVLEMTEQQLTSAAALELQSQGETRVQDVEVRLREGQIIITGRANQDGFSLPFSATLRLTANAQGLPQTEIVKATIGPLPLPESMTSELTSRFNQMVLAEISSNGNGSSVLIDSITITDGKITIVAHTR